jgi:hypothetical protein
MTQTPALLKFGSGPTGNVGANDKKPLPAFPGIEAPSVDLDAVRDGRRAPMMFIDIPLDSTFSIAAGNPIILPISGNSFYIDQDTTVVGTATVHFQDTNLGSKSVPIFAGAGFIAKVPYTQLLIENNTAQAGKVLRIVYGVDIDFTAGVNATIAVTDQTPIRFTGTTQQHTSTTSSAVIVPASSVRKFVMIQNNDAALTTFIAVGVTATATNSFKLAPGASITFDNAVATNVMNSITPGGTNSNIVHLFG